MNKSQLIDALASSYEGNRKAAAQALEAVLDTITREVARGEKVAITGFGSFEKRIRPSRWVRNPRTGERVKAKKTAIAKFSPGADLKAVVAGARKMPKQVVATVDSMTGKKKAPAKAATSASKSTASTSTATKSTASKSVAKKSAAKKAPAKTASKSVAKKSAAKKAPAKTATKSVAKKSAAKKAPAKTATKSVAKKSAAKKAPAKTATKSVAKKAPAKKPATKKAAKKS